MKNNLSDCRLPPAAVDVKGDYVGGYLLVGLAKTVQHHESSVGNRAVPAFPIQSGNYNGFHKWIALSPTF